MRCFSLHCYARVAKLFNKLANTTSMIAALIGRFNIMLQSLVKEPGFENVHYVDLRHTLSNSPTNYRKWWASELHPTGRFILLGPGDRFQAVVTKFQAALATLP